LDHCVYCGAAFPPGFREGFPEPEALKWIDRPGLPPDLAKQLEVMKIVPFDPIRKPRSLVLAIAGFLIPVFGVVFYLIFALLRRYSPLLAVAVLLGGAALVFYLVWRAVNSVRT
jgi:hypothetical protein